VPKPSPDERSRTLADLAAAATRGDARSFELLHKRVGAGVRRMLLKRSNGREDLVDDLAQRTWQSVYLALRDGRYDPARAAITTFVYAVANNAWLSHLRSFARERGYTGAGPGVTAAGAVSESAAVDPSRPEHAASLAELVQAVRDCLGEHSPAGLTEQERLVVRAIGAGETDRGLARRLGLSSSTVNVRKHAAYDKIRAYLASRGLDASALDLPGQTRGEP
jgi:RNA polymerase sigma factor (sigma-70 family)